MRDVSERLRDIQEAIKQITLNGPESPAALAQG